MEEVFGSIFVIALFAIAAWFFFRTGKFALNKAILEPNKNKQISDYKFNEFKIVIDSLFGNTTYKQRDEFGMELMKPLSNGVENIGKIIYSVNDYISNYNSVGEVLKHNYYVKIFCTIPPFYEQTVKSEYFTTLNIDILKSNILTLHDKITNDKNYIKYYNSRQLKELNPNPITTTPKKETPFGLAEMSKQIFPKGEKDVEAGTKELLVILSNKISSEAARETFMNSLSLSIISEKFDLERLKIHLSPYSLKYFTEDELKKFHEYLVFINFSMLMFNKSTADVKTINGDYCS